MRNTKLYRALEQLFGRVQLSCEGEEARVTLPVETAVQRARGKQYHKITGGEQYRVDCPFCGDTKAHLYISHMWGSKTQVSGRTYEAGTGLARCWRRNCLSVPKNREWFRTRLLRALGSVTEVIMTGVEQDITESADMAAVALPVGCVPVESADANKRVIEWLLQRNFSVELLARYRVYVGAVQFSRGSEPLDCAVFPLLRNDRCIGWQARAIDYTKECSYPKYYNNTGFRKSWLLYNMDSATEGPFVVVFEGVTDVLRLDGPGVAIFGKTASRYQERLLAMVGHGRPLVLVPDQDDPDSEKEFTKLRDRLRAERMFSQVVLVKLPDGKDAGAMSKEELWQCILGQVSA